MPFFLARLLRSLLAVRAWMPAAVVGLFVFATSWPLMALAESADAELVEPANYWWWFLVTASTVGYGDLYPVTTWGHVVGVYVIIGGIATLTTLFTQIAAVIEKAKGRRMHGSITVEESDHLVVLGYTRGRTERIIDEVRCECDRDIVLGAWDEVETHPLPDRPVDFVRGDLTDDDVLRRAGVHRAHSVLIDARDDNEALAVTVAVDHVAPRDAPRRRAAGHGTGDARGLRQRGGALHPVAQLPHDHRRVAVPGNHTGVRGVDDPWWR